MTKEADKINICIQCGTPVVGTMKFSGAEWLCVNCGQTMGMLNTLIVESTAELVRQMNSAHARWNQYKNRIIGEGAQKLSCDKCHGDEKHAEHATEEEKRLHGQAINNLNKRMGWNRK